MAISQLGTALKVGFGSFAYTGYVAEDGLTWKKTMGGEDAISNVDNSTMTILLSDPRDEFSMTLNILDATGSTTPPQQGATVTITNPAGDEVLCRCVSGSVAFSRLAAKLSLDLIKEESMTYA